MSDEFEPQEPKKRRPKPRPAATMSDREHGLVRFGLSMAGFGLLGFILPMFGLKFKRVADESQYAVAGGVLIIGLICFVIGLLKFSSRTKGRKVASNLEWTNWARRGIWITGGSVLVLVMLCLGWGWWRNMDRRRRLDVAHRPPQIHQPPMGGQPVPRSGVVGGTTRPTRWPVVMVLRNIKDTDLDALRMRIDQLGGRPLGGALRGKSMANERTVMISDVESFQDFIKKIDFGSVTILDERVWRIAVDVDRTQIK